MSDTEMTEFDRRAFEDLDNATKESMDFKKAWWHENGKKRWLEFEIDGTTANRMNEIVNHPFVFGLEVEKDKIIIEVVVYQDEFL